MEKMVPIGTLTSMLLDPSSGSYRRTYLPSGLPSGTGMGCSSSSDASTQGRPVCWTLRRTASLANTSSFCWTSPWILMDSAEPKMSVSPARRTWREMIFPASARSYSRLESSPVASGCRRSWSTMNRSIVMTDVPWCMMTVTREGDGTALVGAEHEDPPPSQPLEHFGRRMPVPVARPPTDHGPRRRQLRQPFLRAGAAGSVVPHLEQIHRTHRPRQPGFNRNARVRLEQHPRRPVRHQHHHAVIVHVHGDTHPGVVRTEHLNAHTVQRDLVPGSCRPPAGPRCLHRGQELEV